MKKHILISAYAISPYRGSEYGAAWNTVRRLAEQHELWVLYGMSDDHMGDTQTMRDYIKHHPMTDVHFIEVQPTALAKTINLLNKAGFGWFFYFAYYLWQRSALKIAREVVKTIDIDVVHQLGPIGFREPGFLYELDKPMVWGPIGGMGVMDKRLLKNKPLATRVKFAVKAVINHVQINSGRVKQAFAKADVLVAATKAGQKLVKKQFGRNSYYLSEQGIINHTILNEAKFHFINRKIELVWSGTHIERKNFQLCLEALALVHEKGWQLHVLGSGPLTTKWQQLAVELNLKKHILWHGQVSRNEAMQIMTNAHLHIITSIGEDNPAVIFEALSHGVPTLTIDHCGMADVLCDKCAIKIPIAEHKLMVKNIATELEGLLNHPSRLVNMAQTTRLCADEHNWDKRLHLLNEVYDEAIARYEQRTAYAATQQILMA